jgi:hypothetical protein
MAKRPVSTSGANIYLIVACNLSRLSIALGLLLKRPYIYLFANSIIEVRLPILYAVRVWALRLNQIWNRENAIDELVAAAKEGDARTPRTA